MRTEFSLGRWGSSADGWGDGYTTMNVLNALKMVKIAKRKKRKRKKELEVAARRLCNNPDASSYCHCEDCRFMFHC